MLDKFTGIFKQSSNDPRKKKSWQGTIGIAIFTLFVLSSVIVNQSVQALNQVAGNYGYYGGTYGYNASTTSSDNKPSAPTSLSSSVTSTTASLSWTAPTTTTEGTLIATGSGSISSYKFHYNTSSLSSCSGGTSSTPTSASTSLSGLSASTTYYVAICATDNNVNDSAALTGSFTTSATTGGGGTSGGVVSGTITTPAPTVTTPAATPTVTVPTPAVAGPSISSSIVADAAQLATQLGVARNKASEIAYKAKVVASAKEFKVTLAANVQTVVTNFVTYGTSSAAVKLGSGERLALVRDALDTLGSVANNSDKLLTFLEQTANGQKPTIRNLAKEVAQAGIARDMFKKLTGKSAPDFKNAKDDLAWNTILYRIRFVRDLVKEKAGIVKFKAVFGKNPKSPLDWAVVRAWGYSLK